MPITPRMPPRTRPGGSSRTATRHQSRTATSRSASARMISEVACEPELPPELMIERDEQRQHDGPRQLALEVLHRGGGEHLAQEERAEPARALPDHRAEARSRCTARRTPPRRRTSARPPSASRTSASITSSTVTMPRSLPLAVDHRHREQVVLADEPRHLLAVGPGPTVSTAGAARPPRASGVAGSASTSSRSDTTCIEAGGRRIGDVDRVDRLLVRVTALRISARVALDRPGGGTLTNSVVIMPPAVSGAVLQQQRSEAAPVRVSMQGRSRSRCPVGRPRKSSACWSADIAS